MSRHDLLGAARLDERFQGADPIVVNVGGLDGQGVIINDTDLPTESVIGALEADHRALASIMRYSQEIQSPTSRHGSLFDRDRYVTPTSTFGKIVTARAAMADDVVGGLADATEALAFNEVTYVCDDEHEEDGWNQWAGDIDLDGLLRAWWRTLISDSHCVLAGWWSTVSYRSRVKTESGRPSRTVFDNLQMPVRFTIIDTLKVAPVGTMMFGLEQLAYIATREEAMRFDRILGLRSPDTRTIPTTQDEEELRDDIVERLIVDRYHATIEEKAELRKDGIDGTYLYLLDPSSVFRHTLTRGSRRFADIRMESVFPILDSKNLLRQMDRTHLLGGINFIIHIKKGSDKKEGTKREIDALAANAQMLVRLPVMVTDHRVEIEIVKPPLDGILDQEKYRLLNGDIAARMLQTLVMPSGKGDQDPLKMGKLVAEGLESRRKMMRRKFESDVLRMIVARNARLTQVPKMLFRPRQISLVFDPQWASFVFDARMAFELSRDTFLGEFGFDQADEGRQREREAKHWDKVFQTQVPFSPSPDGGDDDEDKPTGPGKEAQQRNAGRRGGGNRGGGGADPGSGQGKPARNPRKKAATSHLKDMLDQPKTEE